MFDWILDLVSLQELYSLSYGLCLLNTDNWNMFQLLIIFKKFILFEKYRQIQLQ